MIGGGAHMGVTALMLESQATEAYVRHNAMYDEVRRLYDYIKEVGYVGPEADAARKKIEELRKAREVTWEEYKHLRDESREQRDYEWYGFSRPVGKSVNLMNKVLGALPRRALVIQPSKQALAEVRSYRLVAFVTLLVAISALLTLVLLVPGMSTSPYSLTYALALFATGSESVAAFISGAVFIVILLKFGLVVERAPNEGGFFAKAAMLEEQWFRMGSEAWTWRQRVTGCLAFGFVHVFNFIYPLASLLVVGVVIGGVATAVYLREYHRSEDVRLATIAAAKFHTTYNYMAVAYFAVALSSVTLISFFS